MHTLSNLVSKFPKCHLFLFATSRNAKNNFQKRCFINKITDFFTRCSYENNGILLRLGTHDTKLYEYKVYARSFGTSAAFDPK